MQVAAINTITEPALTYTFPVEDLRPGMACLTSNGHKVRINAIQSPYAHVHFVRAPHIDGDVDLSELAPITVKVQIGDEVMLHAGDEGQMIRGRVESIDGNYANFFLHSYNETHRAHTAHVMSIRPQAKRQAVQHD